MMVPAPTESPEDSGCTSTRKSKRHSCVKYEPRSQQVEDACTATPLIAIWHQDPVLVDSVGGG